MTEPLTMFYTDPQRDANKWLRPALMTSNSVEWYTPPRIRDAVVEALGGNVDLDPCADPERTFPATQHFTPAENGLAQRWMGRVYMNPPYGRTIRRWTTKLKDELEVGYTFEAVALLPARPDARWFQELDPPFLCFIRGRLRFSGYDASAPFSSVACYFGDHPHRFMHAFAGLGIFYDKP